MRQQKQSAQVHRLRRRVKEFERLDAPGPWRFSDFDGEWDQVVDANDNIVANVNTESGPDLPPLVSTKMPCKANANLIIAAPDLYEALGQQLSQWQLVANMVEDDAAVTSTIEASMQLINNALRAARGEK
jgi:hypothetical protein